MDSINTDSNKDNSGTNLTDHPPPISLQGAKDNQNNTNNTEQKTAKPDNSTTVFEKIMIVANICLVILTAVLAYANWKVSQDSGDQIKATFQLAKATQDMALATKKSIIIADSSVSIEHQNMVIGNTAYFTIRLNISPRPVAGQRFFAHVNYINVGKTPALNVRKLMIFNNDFKTNIHKMQIISNTSANINKGIVPPTDSVNQDLDTRYVFTNDIINQIYSGERVFSINIGIKYQDIFGNWYWMAEREIFNPKDNNFCEDTTGNEYIKLH